MKIKCIIIALTFLLSCLFVVTVKAEVIVPETVRIGLFYNSTAPTEICISGISELSCWVAEEEIKGTEFNFIATETGFKIGDYEVFDTKAEIYPNEGFVYVENKPYRGYIKLLNNNGKITVINVVKLEDYLYGVVPLEMSTGWPIEALKSQAICARTYSISSIGRFENYGFDMTDTVLSQVYGGVSVEKEDCTVAVDDTKGKIVTYDGELASTFYFATSSGQTLDVKDVWGSTNYPYLVSVDDSLQGNVIKNNGPWSVDFSKQEINNLLSKNNLNIGEIVDIDTEKNDVGAVTKLILQGTDGIKTYLRESARNFFGLKSQVYDIIKNTNQNQSICVIGANGKDTLNKNVSALTSDGTSTIESMKVLTSNGIESIEKENKFDSITINGVGNGHGIGMSQNGAKAMANEGYTYDQIITHYFTGVEITTAY